MTHLESALDGTILPADGGRTTHRARPLWVRYDLDAVRGAVSRAAIERREPTMWRYRELLPVGADGPIVSLGETMTPLVACPRLAAALGIETLWIKDESRLPTGSFKARGMAMAVSMLARRGVRCVAVPSAGNAGGALAAYAARAAMTCVVFMPHDAPLVNRAEAALYGARVILVRGLISDCGRIVGEGSERLGWSDLSTLREPWRVEGKKTMGLELAEQMGWRLPGVILYPTGGGTGLIGMWKAFGEMERLGWLPEARRPRMLCCQSSGCDPLVRAFEAGAEFAAAPAEARTVAAGLRVPGAVGDFMILSAVRESGGMCLRAEESRLLHWMHECSRLEGVALCPESAACLDVLKQALAAGSIGRDEEVVIFNTGAAQKYVELMPAEFPVIDPGAALDWEVLGRP